MGGSPHANLHNFQKALTFQINHFIIIGGFYILYRSNNLFIDLKAGYWCPLLELWKSISSLFSNSLWNNRLNISLPKLHQISLSPGVGGGGGFPAHFLGIIISNIVSYYRDITCSKYITESFVIHSDNDIQE